MHKFQKPDDDGRREGKKKGECGRVGGSLF